MCEVDARRLQDIVLVHLEEACPFRPFPAERESVVQPANSREDEGLELLLANARIRSNEVIQLLINSFFFVEIRSARSLERINR